MIHFGECIECVLQSNIIRREAPRCSFNSDGHMPEPQEAGRVTDTDSHAFFVIGWTVSLPAKKSILTVTMKKTIIGLVALLLFSASGISHSQAITKEQRKERQELAKASKKELNQKASKAARKEAKRLSKEGWKTAPGALPLEKQLDKSYMMQYQYDSDGFPQYIMAEAMSTAGNYDAAKMQALELAKQNLAGQIQTEISALIANTVANEQMDQGDAASITRSVMASKNIISQSIGRVVPIVETYRMVNGNNREVLVRIAYSQEMAKAAAKKAVKKELEDRGEILHGKLDELLGF